MNATNSGTKKILIIEDDKSLAHALELKLVHEGFEVVVLSSGVNVIPTLTKDNFSLIICDLMMPVVDGFQVLQILGENKIKTPVIVITNLSQPEDEKKARDLGAVDFLVKSDTPLLKIIEKINQLI